MNSSGNGSTRAPEPAPEEPLDLGLLDHILDDFKGCKGAVIPILQSIQSCYGYLPPEALRHICEATAITPAQVSGIATFYADFRLTPIGKHLIRVCHGTACHVAGARQVTDELRRLMKQFEFRHGMIRRMDMRFRFQRRRCDGR